MDLEIRVKAYSLLLIMLLLPLHDVIPHTHYLASNFISHIATGHFHHHHHHDHGEVAHSHDHDQSDNDQDPSLLDYLMEQHQQFSHSPLICRSFPKITRHRYIEINAISAATFQISNLKKTFLHHYCLFDAGLLDYSFLLPDFSRRGPPLLG